MTNFLKMRLLIVFVTACLLAPAVAQAQTATDIIQNYFDTVSNGDFNNWTKIKSAYIESVSYYNDDEFQSPIPSFLNKGKPVYVREYREYPYKTRRESYSDSLYTIPTSTMLWLKDKLVMSFAQMDPVVKPLREPNQNTFTPIFLSNLLRDSESISYEGVKKFPQDGISCHDIEVVTHTDTINYYFNTETYLLEYYKIFNETDTLNYARLANYQKIDGLLFHTEVYGMKNGRIFHSEKIKKIQLNAPMSPDKFRYR